MFSRRVILFLISFLVGCALVIAMSCSQCSLGNWVHPLSLLDWQGWFTVGIFLMTFSLLVLELLPPDITMLLSASLLTISEVITPTEFLAGYSKDVLFTIAMLSILVRALEVNGILKKLASWILPTDRTKERELVGMLLPVCFGSAFLNNTPIVLVMASLVKSWAIKQKKYASKYLIPISFATILGGICTLIGTSTNLIVEGLFRAKFPGASIGFFEFSKLGLPICLIGLPYLIFIGHRLLPNRQDPTVDFSAHTEEYTQTFLIGEGCPLANVQLKDVKRKYFHNCLILQIVRLGRAASSRDDEAYLLLGDRIVVGGDLEEIAQLHEVPGLLLMQDPEFKVDMGSSHYSEVVVASSSSLIGKTLQHTDFRMLYGASIVAVYRHGVRVLSDLKELYFQPGDSLILLSNDPLAFSTRRNQDFFVIRDNVKLATYNPFHGGIALLSVAGVVVGTALGVPVLISVMAATLLCMGCSAISIDEARKSIPWNLLILIGSSFALGMAMQKTGVTDLFAKLFINLAGNSVHALIGGIFLVTVIVTEVITNNATALIIFPIAIEAAHLMGLDSSTSMKAIAMTVACASSCAFLTPIGYQTNTIVYGPGSYRFYDYFFVGFPLTCL
ncbi:MAG: anion permease, partial [Chlamydiia bacterium]|nr:anion permease [Chlamydiia bacterium]